MSLRALVADGFVLSGVIVITLAVYGVMRLPDTFARIHSASKAAALGVVLLLLATVTSGELDMMVRALVVAVFLCITAPVGSHAAARLERACREGELRERRFGALAAQTQALPPSARTRSTRKSPREAAGSSRALRRDTPPSEGEARDPPRRP